MTDAGTARPSRRGSENRQRQGRISARVDPGEQRRVEEAAARLGVSVADFIRTAALIAAAS